VRGDPSLRTEVSAVASGCARRSDHQRAISARRQLVEQRPARSSANDSVRGVSCEHRAGSMGSVYLGERCDGQFEQRRGGETPESPCSPPMLARFNGERQISLDSLRTSRALTAAPDEAVPTS
jgi:hypothetical protein